jgi:predicted lipid-binding transport protein (Tim44 family)
MAIVLVIMWLVVLVPMFVRRGEDRAETRSMDRFATAMRVLSRRPAGGGSRGIAGRRRYATAAPAPYADGTSPVRTAARDRMLRRRRRTLGTLATTALVGALGALAVSAWLWLVAVPAVLLLAGYVGWLRAQVRREYERRTRRAALFGEHPAPTGEHSVRRPARIATAVAAEEDTAVPDRSWHPVPVPAPTYATAPAHRYAAGAVDLDDDDLSFTELDGVGAYNRPRAVNE